MQTTFRLIEDDRSFRVHYCVGDLFSTMGGQAVHEDGVRSRSRHEFLVHLVRRENSGALPSFVLLAHAGPRVGVNRVDAFNRRMRIGKYIDDRAGLFRYLLGIGDDFCVGTVTQRAWPPGSSIQGTRT